MRTYNIVKSSLMLQFRSLVLFIL
uniref:Uncharacterized protein n=1 Tax=Rhizophora mucronata TaxID=61149 RepID=A0A2P2N9R8_RHIMU